MRLLLNHGADVDVRTADGATALSRAILFGGPEHVHLLLEHGADTEARVDGATRGETPLIRLAGRGLATMVGWHKDPEQLARVEARDDEMLRLLLEHEADIEARDRADGRTALMHAAANGRGGAVRILLEAGAEIDAHDERYGRTALIWAAIRCQSSIVRILLEAGADTDAEDLDGERAAELAHRAGFRDIVPLLRAAEGQAPRPRGPSPGALKVAARAGNADAIRAVLREGLDVNARLSGGMTALFLAAQMGRDRAVAALLEAGADPNARDREGETPLNAAIRAKSPEAVRLLLRAGADPDASGKEVEGIGRETPLILALSDPPLDVPDAGPGEPDDSREVDASGAVQGTILRELIAAGASVDAPDEEGNRPLWYAFDTGQDELAALLVQAGAGREPVGAAYVRARSLAGPARSESFREAVRALATLRDAEPEPITSRVTQSDWRDLGPGGRYPTASMIGVEVIVSREQAESLLAEHRGAFLRRGSFLFRSRRYGDGHDHQSQRLGLLPTVDKYVVITAIGRAGSDWGWVSPGYYIRDLMAIERDHPFSLIGCEPHSLELEFPASIPHRHELARKLKAIRTHLIGPGLPEYPDLEDVVEYLKTGVRIGFYWE
jgi:ankyrin repeat protein